ncbi:hypothetical protein [Ekhidna sp. To15]|uniref:hypothetical protein n=1 Tax=Ekhidna sp. To15 TaxID=3395267 RepID=UPI003F526B3A
MEFDEMQKIWNEQKGETMYAINETALHKSITRKKNAASKRIDMVENWISLINGTVAVFLFIDALDDPHYWDFVGSAMMLATVIYIQISRYKRLKAENMFDRSMFGELDHAIANTNSIIHISRMMVIGYLVPFSFFYILKMIVIEASLEKWLLVTGMYILSFVLIYWERKKMHIPRKENLEVLKKKLMEE